jgi:hypothetical protein
MASRPTPWQRLVALLRGEASAAALEAYRRASLPVYELMDAVERRRLEYAEAGTDAWRVSTSVRAETVCAWNAFVLQTLGDAIVDADYQESPATAGFVPRVTADQVMRFYGQVERWLNLAHQARANPAGRLTGAVPAPLPEWVPGPSPHSHLKGLLVAMRSLESHASAAVACLSTPEPREAEWKRQLTGIQQVHASALTTARYAEELCGAEAADEVRARAEPHVRRAIEQLFRVGQLAADPHRATPEALREPATSVRELPSPGAARPRFAWPHAPASHAVDPGAPETIERTDTRIPDRFGLYVTPGERIKHNILGSGEYLGIGTRGSVFMRKDNGQVITFADRHFRRE